MIKNWHPLLGHFSATLNQTPSHLAPSVSFPTTHLKQNTGVCPLTNVGFLSVIGDDAEKFLQGQLTCDLREINLFITKFSGHCNPKGRLHGIFHIIQINPHCYYLAMPIAQIEHVKRSLTKYAIFSKVKIESLFLYSFGLVGDSFHMNKTNIDALSKIAILDKYDIPSHSISYIRLPCHDSTLFRFLVIFTSSKISTHQIQEYWENMNLLGFENINTTDWHTFNLLALIPNIYPETTEKCLPHHLNLPKLGAVSFKKGCYTGQEIISRMEYLGKVKKNLSCRPFQPELLPPALGEDLLDYVPLPSSFSKEPNFLGLFVTDV